MVHSIRGVVTLKTAEMIGVETLGIEWAVETTATSLSRFPSVGEEVRVWTHLHHKEDQMRLYGFATREERALFLDLITVSGIGPALARKVLSGTTPESLKSALETEDLALLGSIPGLGKKTAQKVVLQLRGRLTADDDAAAAPGEEKELVESLVARGFDAKASGSAVRDLLQDSDIAGLSGEDREKELIRRAIVALSS
jgi:Holliday junction DNA helicase RuvA